MSIDWFTTGAQIINFLILVWLLKRLLFKPIIGAMERREQGLSDRLQQAETKMAEAQSLKNQYEQQLQQLNTEKELILSQAKKQAATEKLQLVQSLNEEIQQKKIQFEKEIQQQQKELGPLMSQTIAEKSLLISRQILSQLVDQTLDQRIIDHFLQHLSDLPNKEQVQIKQALEQDLQALILTSFKPDVLAEKQIQTWFDSFSPGYKLSFEQRDYLLSGIALEASGFIWEWSVDRYLTELDSELL